MKKLIFLAQLLTLILIVNQLEAEDYIMVGDAKSYYLDSTFSQLDKLLWKGFYLLSPDEIPRRGAIWSTNKVNFKDSLSISFIANFGDKEIGADGITLVQLHFFFQPTLLHLIYNCLTPLYF